ncbi:MAG TPA: response regulator [Candidatus Thermoplasmatota archaeon]|nr:response regulator [Candidatus Thermoplasmatota archaeon]
MGAAAPPGVRKPLRSILVVDDEPDILELMELFIRDSFPSTMLYTAKDAPQAFAVMEAHAIDAIVSDYKLPGMDGIQLLAEAGRRTPGIRRALVTAFSDSSLEDRARREAGVDHFLAKTFRPEDFLVALAAMLD